MSSAAIFVWRFKGVNSLKDVVYSFLNFGHYGSLLRNLYSSQEYLNKFHGDEPYRILVVQNRILFVISGLYLCKRVLVGRGKYPENHM